MIVAIYVAGILYQGFLGQRNHLTISDIPTNQPIAIIGSIQLGAFVRGSIPMVGSIPNRSIAPIPAGITAVKTSVKDTVSPNALTRSRYKP